MRGCHPKRSRPNDYELGIDEMSTSTGGDSTGASHNGMRYSNDPSALLLRQCRPDAHTVARECNAFSEVRPRVPARLGKLRNSRRNDDDSLAITNDRPVLRCRVEISFHAELHRQLLV